MAVMRLLLVDATGYLFRAFHAVGDLRTKAGAPTGAIFGLVNMLNKLRQKWPAERVVCVMDAPGKTFRHAMSPAYKANRPPLNADLRVQIEPAKQFINAMGWPLMCVSGVEADDVIATLAVQGRQAAMEVIIASGDKDLMQMVGGGVRMFDGVKEKIFDEAAVRDKFGVSPQQMGDYLALIGDTSDNIRGVEKVGPKTAAKWLAASQTLDAIIAQADSIGGVVGKNLRTAIADGTLTLARRLVALKADVPLARDIEACVPAPPAAATWRELCERYEFRQWATMNNARSAARAAVETVTALPRLQEWLAAARRAAAVTIDTETDGAPVMQARLVGFSLALDDKAACYVPLAHEDGAQQIPMTEALPALRSLLADVAVCKVFHNGKYDLHVLENCGLSVAGVVEDTKVAACLHSPGQQTSLAALAQRYLNIKTTTYREVVDGKQVKNFSQAAIATAARYAAGDAEITHKLRRPIIDSLNKDARRLYETIDRPLVRVLQAVERVGVRIDDKSLRDFAEQMHRRMQALEAEAYQAAGGAFNINSPRQLETLLFDEMGAAPLHKTGSKKARSTDERTLEKLAADYPLARLVLEHRTLAKLTGTYADKLPQMINPASGRVHTDFNQTSVNTGRLASSAPNLQNIPARTAAGRRIRQAFVAADKCVLISADYSQIELRLMAHIAADEALLAAFAAGADIHRRTAAEIFSVPEAQVGATQRRAAKAINFGLIYGMSEHGLARTLNTGKEQAREYIGRYFSRYPQVADFMHNIRRQAAAQGFVKTIIGRRIPVLAGNAQAAARAAINAPMQGSAADIIKMAMIKTQSWLRDNNMQTRMILQVHDELVLEAPLAEADCIMAQLPLLMCGVAQLRAPLEVGINCGDNWDSAH